ncbi:MAG TPA: XRE family transcriptional regulator [Pyrinomonadaceae bacterium]|nr:XRE family transcriptional regulator [Pyrinomonadaceae bacterium]
MVEAAHAQNVGSRVKKLRARQGLTLEALAELSGVSRAMLSKIERGEKNPTLVVAAKVAQALRVGLTDLMGVSESRRAVVLIPKSSRMVFRDPETGFERQLLSPAFESRSVEFVRHVIPKGATSGDLPAYKAGTEKYLVVEQGRLGVVIEGHAHHLNAGDSLYFEADAPHRFENTGKGVCSYYLVVSSCAK